MATKIINFFDGYTTGSTPTQIGIQNLLSYVNDAAFEADNTGTPIAGNLYYNSTDLTIRYYTNSWKELSDEDDLQPITSDILALQTQANDTDADLGALDITVTNFITSKAQADGLAPLDSSSKVPAVNLPSYVDDVEEYADLASLPAIGEQGKIYVTLDDNKQFRWSGSVYVEVSPSDVNSVNGLTGIITLDKTHIGLSNVTDDSQLKRSAGDFTFTEKETPVNDDIVIIEDSESGGAKKVVKLSNLLGSGQGGINYLEKNGDADNGLGDWLDLANGTVAVNETTPLSGDADFVFTQGVETGGIADCLFTIDKAGLVRKQYLSFDYDLSSLTSTIQTYPIHVTITDATGVTLYSSTISTLTENKQGTFLTDFQIDPSVSVYKLNFSRVAAGPPPEAISFNIDNIRVAPREVTKSIGKTSFSSVIEVNNDITYNESQVVSLSTGSAIRKIYYNKGMFPNEPLVTAIVISLDGTSPTSTVVSTYGSDGSGDFVTVKTYSGGSNIGLTGTDQLQVTFTQKEEDQTAYQISTDLGNRLIHSYGIKPLGASVANTSIKWVADTDTVGMYDGVAGQWEIPNDGVYVFNGSYDAGSSQVRSFHIYKNNVLLASIHDSDVNQIYKLNYQGLFKQGDLVDIRIPTSATAIGATTYTTYMSVSKQGNDAPMLGVTAPQIAIFKDVKASGVTAGSSTAGAFNTRELNSHSGLSTFATLSSNEITLESGKYTIDASAPAWFSNGHQLRMYNVTNAAVLVDDNGDDCYGSVSWSSSAAIDRSQGSFVITINAPTTIRLEHRVSASKATDGLGNALSFGLEVYAMLKIQKIY